MIGAKFLRNKIGQFLLLFFGQILLLNPNFSNVYISPQLYILFFLFFPITFNKNHFLLLSFLLGLFMDVFTYSLGFHALSCTVLAYIRPYMLELNAPNEGYENGAVPNSKKFDLIWFLTYGGSLILIFHIVLFYLDNGGFDGVVFTFLKSLLNSFIVLVFAFIFRKIIQTK